MTEYDLAQREQLRQTLLAYMKEHKIGVPRLAARIKETVHRNPEIPVNRALDHAPLMHGDGGINQIASERSHPRRMRSSSAAASRL